MGIFTRPDSPYWWIYLEGPRRRIRTKILVRGRAEERAATARYCALMLAEADEETDVLLARAIELLRRRREPTRLTD